VIFFPGGGLARLSVARVRAREGSAGEEKRRRPLRAGKGRRIPFFVRGRSRVTSCGYTSKKEQPLPGRRRVSSILRRGRRRIFCHGGGRCIEFLGGSARVYGGRKLYVKKKGCSALAKKKHEEKVT